MAATLDLARQPRANLANPTPQHPRASIPTRERTTLLSTTAPPPPPPPCLCRFHDGGIYIKKTCIDRLEQKRGDALNRPSPPLRHTGLRHPRPVHRAYSPAYHGSRRAGRIDAIRSQPVFPYPSLTRSFILDRVRGTYADGRHRIIIIHLNTSARPHDHSHRRNRPRRTSNATPYVPDTTDSAAQSRRRLLSSSMHAQSFSLAVPARGF